MVLEVCREYRVILFEELPTIVDPSSGEPRTATDRELQSLGIFVFRRGSSRAQAICNGFKGDSWPGELICGGPGIYGPRRRELIEASLREYNGGVSNGRTALLDTAFDDEPGAATGSAGGP